MVSLLTQSWFEVGGFSGCLSQCSQQNPQLNVLTVRGQLQCHFCEIITINVRVGHPQTMSNYKMTRPKRVQISHGKSTQEY